MTSWARRELWLIRHAESAWNAMRLWQGHADPGLSARGVAQAEALAERLAGMRIEAIVASDLRRARETARIVAAGLRLEPSHDARLRERDLGSWSGLTTPQIAGRWPEQLARLRARDVDFRPGGGESIRQVTVRAAAFFRELALRPGPARWAIVTHGGLIRALRPDRATPIANAEAVRVTLGELLAACEPEAITTIGAAAAERL
ncbi:phosphoglycerate mutase family protein [Myxococcota bacterium]|nr:phosphoglycerate mutase family protein [Myxococcota bacterium]MCZ7619456.1 histidine phosphatase family protein [Myxococcota bacterium]